MAAISTAAATELTPAERIRSVLAAATSLVMVTESWRVELLGRHTVDPNGALLLELPTDSPPVAQIMCAPLGDVPATVEITDVAPVAVRDRIRARVTLAGWLAHEDSNDVNANEETRLRFDTAHAWLQQDPSAALLDRDEIAGADADPLAELEAELLTHLDHAHPEAVDQLTRLVEPRLVQRAQQIRPLRLDRYGLVLRIEKRRGHHDVRLPFAAPLRCADDIGFAVQHLLTLATACPRRRRRWT